MSNVSSSIGHKGLSPRLRFPEFEEEWKYHLLNDFLSESKILGSDGKQAKKLSVKLWAKGVVEKNTVFEGSENTQYYIRKAGQLMYGKLDFLNCAFGIVPPELDGYESTLDAPAFDINNINPNFLLNRIIQRSFYKKNGDIANGSRKAKRIHPDTFLSMEIATPSLQEQNKIAKFLAVLEQRINKQNCLLTALKSYKRGVINKIFSQKIRYKEHSKTEWKWLKISDLFESVIDKNHSEEPVLTIVQGAGTVPRESIERHISYNKDSVNTYKLVKKGDFILHLRSFEGGLEVANEQGIVSPAYTILRAKSAIATKFYYVYFRSFEFIENKLRISVEGIRDGKSINMKTFWNIEIPAPCLEEQNKIAAFLEKLDSRLYIETDLLEHLIMLKTALLQQMFI